MPHQRNQSADLLRCVSCIMIILLHVGAFYQEEAAALWVQAGLFCQAITRTAVPCFVLLSGALLLRDPRCAEYPYMLKKTWRTIAKPTLIYSVLFILISCITYRFGFSQADYREVLLLAVQGYPYPHMWYMFMILGLYLCTPLLMVFKTQCLQKPKAAPWLIAGLVVLGIVIQSTCSLIWPVKFIPYIGYFFAGDAIATYVKQKKLPWFGLLWVAAIAVSALAQLGVVPLPAFFHAGLAPTDPLNPLVVVASLSCFTFFLSLPISFSTYPLARHTGRIYLIHMLILQVIKTVWIRVGGALPQPFWGIPLITLMTLVLSLGYAMAVSALFDRKNRRA